MAPKRKSPYEVTSSSMERDDFVFSHPFVTVRVGKVPKFDFQVSLEPDGTISRVNGVDKGLLNYFMRDHLYPAMQKASVCYHSRTTENKFRALASCFFPIFTYLAPEASDAHLLTQRVVAGASIGSILCSFAATRTWPELQAYDLSGRVLGISVCSPRRHEPPRCLNYLASPHVVIWSAVTASCAFPGLFEAQDLMAKDRKGRIVPYHTLSQVGPEETVISKRQWRDGSLESDLPMMQLKELFNVNHFIVSQANPHIAPLLRLKELVRAYGGDFAAKLAHLTEMEVKHRCNQVLEMGYRLFGLAKLFAQDWEGDVTIVMPATFAQFAKLIQNPTPSELRKAVMQGRRCTWAKLSAIQANCGIELMLDECVSELNRRRRAQKEAERNTAHAAGVFTTRVSKRIPSWNCLARESSWGSLDEENMEGSIQAGGPWGGPTLRRLRPLRHNHDGSDSDSGTEEFSNLSWTKAGGPLMRTASATKFLASLETDAESGVAGKEEVVKLSQESSPKDVEVVNVATRLNRANSWDLRSSKHANKIWEGPPGAADINTEDGLSFQAGMKKSASEEAFSFQSAMNKCGGTEEALPH